MRKLNKSALHHIANIHNKIKLGEGSNVHNLEINTLFIWIIYRNPLAFSKSFYFSIGAFAS
uniref:Uncharacterized protein n=1 Tax=Anguilla anguilla TaxID=7936 RepID=A0A0E9PAE4_ANGAN